MERDGVLLAIGNHHHDRFSLDHQRQKITTFLVLPVNNLDILKIEDLGPVAKPQIAVQFVDFARVLFERRETVLGHRRNGGSGNQDK